MSDPDAPAEEWSRTPRDTDYGRREGAHLDLGNSLIRFGAELP